jgi:hypothetical protein
MLGLKPNSLRASTVTQMWLPGAGKYIRAFPLMPAVDFAAGALGVCVAFASRTPWAGTASAAEMPTTVVVAAATASGATNRGVVLIT